MTRETCLGIKCLERLLNDLDYYNEEIESYEKKKRLGDEEQRRRADIYITDTEGARVSVVKDIGTRLGKLKKQMDEAGEEKCDVVIRAERVRVAEPTEVQETESSDLGSGEDV